MHPKGIHPTQSRNTIDYLVYVKHTREHIHLHFFIFSFCFVLRCDSVPQTSFKCTILLFQPSKCYNYKLVLPSLLPHLFITRLFICPFIIFELCFAGNSCSDLSGDEEKREHLTQSFSNKES